MAGLWGKFSNFISNLEKTIDNDFENMEASMNAPVNIEKKEIIAELSDDEKIEPEETKEVEADDNSRKQELISKIKAAEQELENNQKEVEKFQNVIDQIGAAGASLLDEFDTRQEKLQAIYDKLLLNEKTIQNEIDDASHADELLNSVTAQHTKARRLLEEYEIEFDQAKIAYDELVSDEKKVDNSIQNLNEMIEELTNEKLEIEQKTSSFLSKATEKESKIEKLEKDNEEISNTASSMAATVSTFKEKQINLFTKKVSLENQRNEILNKLNEASVAQQIENRKQIENRVTAMKDFAQEIMNKQDQEIKTLNQETETLQSEIKLENINFEREKQNYEKLITQAEVEEEQLKIKLDDCKANNPRTLLSLQTKLDTLKSVFESTETVQNETISRLKNDLIEIQVKNETISEEIKNLQNSLAELNKEKAESKASHEEKKRKRQEYEEEIAKINQEINNLNEIIKSKHEMKLNLEDESKKLVLESTKLKDTIEIRENKYNQMKNDLNAQLSDYKRIIETNNEPTTFMKWKSLCEKCASLDKEIAMLQIELQQSSGLDLVFSQTLETLAERQDTLEIVKRTIAREKQCFQQKLQELL